MSAAIPTPDEEIDAIALSIQALTVTVHTRAVKRDLAIGRAILEAVDSADPFPLLRALAADLGAVEEPAPLRPPAIVPERSALTVDMALRFRYDPGGVFVLPGRPLHVPAPRDYDVRGLRVRICYEHAPGEAEAAGEVAASWVGRMLMAGAVGVEAVGEEIQS